MTTKQLFFPRVSSKYLVKVGDFGMARDIYQRDYYREKPGQYRPVKWTAQEVLEGEKYTTSSDVVKSSYEKKR